MGSIPPLVFVNTVPIHRYYLTAMSSHEQDDTEDGDTAALEISSTAQQKKPARKKKPLPRELSRLTAKNLHQIIVEQRVMDKDVAGLDIKKGQECSVAIGVKLIGCEKEEDDDNDEMDDFIFDLEKNLTLDQLRQFTKNMGIPNGSKMSKIACLIAISLAKERLSIIGGERGMKEVVAGTESQKQEFNQKRYNTLVRMTNVLFSEEFLQNMLTWNDARSRYDHEIGVGGKMQRFFEDVSKAMSTTNLEMDSESASSGDNAEAKDIFGSIDQFEDDENHEIIQERIHLFSENPSDYLVQPGNVLQEWTLKLLRCRRQLQVLMTTSGEHNDDMFNFCEAALRRTKLTNLLGVFPVYYFCLKASKVTDFDKKFQPFMDETLKGDSTNTPTSISSSSTDRNNRGRPKDDDKLVELISVVKQLAENDKVATSVKEAETALSASAKQAQAEARQAQAALSKQQMRNEQIKELQIIRSELNAMEQDDSDDSLYRKMKKRKVELIK